MSSPWHETTVHESMEIAANVTETRQGSETETTVSTKKSGSRKSGDIHKGTIFIHFRGFYTLQGQ
jgi:hypothetical protein